MQVGCESDPKKVKLHNEDVFEYKAVFGLPWDYESFVAKAVQVGHPLAHHHTVPPDLKLALDKQTEWSDQQLVDYRIQWCRKWLKRAKELETAEKIDAQTRDAHVRATTANKRVLLAAEILESLGYEDMEVLELLRRGSPLAGGIPKSNIFELCFKPGLLTVDQLLCESARRNQAVMSSCSTSGDLEVDKSVLRETEEEVRLGWAVGPVKLPASDCVVSKRFPLVQRNKTRMIDDFSISGINDTAATENKVDLHMVDTFGAVVRAFFSCCSELGGSSELVGKTYTI